MNVALKVGNSNLYKSAAENEFRALLSKQVSATQVSWVLAETELNVATLFHPDSPLEKKAIDWKHQVLGFTSTLELETQFSLNFKGSL